MLWRVNGQILALAAAGPRALLMQIAHPLIAEGVDQHSGFREDPRARLEATSQSYLRMVFGGERAARAEARRLRRIHATIRGPVTDEPLRQAGVERYSALDPELMLWVHATLVESVLVGYLAWVAPLSEQDQATYYRESRWLGVAMGIPVSLIPENIEEFRAYMAGALSPSGPVHVTETGRRLATAVLHPRPSSFLLPPAAASRVPALFAAVVGKVDLVPAWLYEWLVWPSLDLLPASLQTEYGLSLTARQRVVSQALVRGYRFWSSILPDFMRRVPRANAPTSRPLWERGRGRCGRGRRDSPVR